MCCAVPGMSASNTPARLRLIPLPAGEGPRISAAALQEHEGSGVGITFSLPERGGADAGPVVASIFPGSAADVDGTAQVGTQGGASGRVEPRAGGALGAGRAARVQARGAGCRGPAHPGPPAPLRAPPELTRRRARPACGACCAMCQVGDRLTSVDGEPVRTWSLAKTRRIIASKAGTRVVLGLDRGGQKLLASLSSAQPAGSSAAGGDTWLDESRAQQLSLSALAADRDTAAPSVARLSGSKLESERPAPSVSRLGSNAVQVEQLQARCKVRMPVAG